MNKQITYLPIEKFLVASHSANRGPDPVPAALACAAFLFLVSAFLTL